MLFYKIFLHVPIFLVVWTLDIASTLSYFYVLFAAGDLRHLIVEACVARNLLDTSAYLWPGYVKGHANQIPQTIGGQMPGWSSLMKGSPLTPPMVHALVSTPASRYACTCDFSILNPHWESKSISNSFSKLKKMENMGILSQYCAPTASPKLSPKWRK